ncbi:hypothetical protein MMC10_006512 [Thelotrema lepadinum]|nr:hypothetical protein [Thelotrema lepadinum]
MGVVVSVLQAIGRGIMAVVNGIVSIIMGIVHGVADVFMIIINFLTCRGGKGRRHRGGTSAV